MGRSQGERNIHVLQSVLRHWWRRHRQARGEATRLVTAWAVLVIGWMGGVAMGGVVGFRYSECRLVPHNAEAMREELNRQLSGIGTAQIGASTDAEARNRLEAEEANLRRRLAQLDDLPAANSLALWRTLTQCPSTWQPPAGP